MRDALVLTNQTLGEVLPDQEGDFDSDSRWAVAWFEHHGSAEGDYGVAETLSTVKNTSVQGLVEARILVSGAGKLRLLRPKKLPEGWDPATDIRCPVWEVVHHLIRGLDAGGEDGAEKLVARLGGTAEAARELCYRLYTLCDSKEADRGGLRLQYPRAKLAGNHATVLTRRIPTARVAVHRNILIGSDSASSRPRKKRQ